MQIEASSFCGILQAQTTPSGVGAPLMIGQNISHYRIVERLGAGGMGVVYRAEDVRLRRAVALKFLPIEATQDRDARDRLVAEAQTASALDHPNICTIYEIDETPDGRMFLAMSYYEGETLKERIARGPMAIDDALDVIAQTARAVAAAHDADVVHRDIKPANIMLTRRGEVKLLDFGIAKLSGRTALTRTGTTVGTIAYMSPEQLVGQGGDVLSDIWALGVVLYEMVAGSLPFPGEHDVAVISAIANAAPKPLRAIRADTPRELEQIVRHALEGKRDARYQSAHDFLRDVEALRDRRAGTGAIDPATTRPAVPPWQRRTVVAVVAASVALVAAAGWYMYRGTRTQRLRDTVLPRIVALQQEEQFAAAYRLLRSVEHDLAGDPELEKVRKSTLFASTIRTSPPGAELYIKGYGELKEDWLYLGRSPLQDTPTPLGYYRWRVVKEGYSTLEAAGQLGMAEVNRTLQPAGTLPAGMVHVPGATIQIQDVGPHALPPFYIDVHEVTNRDYKRFVDADGYRSRKYWTEPFVRGGREMSWEDGLREMRDQTGRPGPSTWELGTYPQGQDDFPVRGVSWYEAAAFAKFAGKRLPTLHHWRRAAAAGVFSDILEHSNFSAKGPAAVGTYRGLGEFGTYDMAGNVKEWAFTAVGDKRFALGGAWNEPNYKFRETDALLPWDRAPGNGFRCMSLVPNTSVDAALDRPVTRVVRDYSRETPVPDDVFRIYQGLYAYDRTDLKAVVESTDDSSEFWRTERITYAAAYGNERIIAYLFLPKNTKPPYQMVVYFPHSGGEYLRSFEQSEMNYLGFIVKGGRALLLPMYKGTYERRLERAPDGPNATRDLMIQRMKDLQRSVDYLETRADFDRPRLAFFGVSLGGRLGSIALAIEQRFKAAVLWSGGFRRTPTLPEIDEINYAPRVRTPVLMLNGRDDFTFPIETSQAPMFSLLGTPEPDKRHVLYDGGHVFPFARIMKDSLDWLDHYLGPVK